MNKKRSVKKRDTRKRKQRNTKKGGYVWKSAQKSKTKSVRKGMKNTKSIMSAFIPPVIN